MERKFPVARFVLAFFIASALFALMFLIAYSVAYLDYQQTTHYNRMISSSLAKMSDLLATKSCDSSQFIEASNLLDVVGSRIALLEERLGKNDKSLLQLKSAYTQIQIQHMLLVEKFNNNCNSSFKILLFFYSNSPEKYDASERAGYVLQALKEKHPLQIMIYSFDTDLPYPPIAEFEKRYNITNIPVVVLNNTQKIEVRNLFEIEPLVIGNSSKN